MLVAPQFAPGCGEMASEVAIVIQSPEGGVWNEQVRRPSLYNRGELLESLVAIRGMVPGVHAVIGLREVHGPSARADGVH